MPLLLRFVLLISIATLVLAGLHYYVYTRVGRHLMLGPEELRVVKYVLIALFVLLWGAIPLSRLLRFPTIRGVMWAAYIWLGSLVVASVAFAGGDLLRLALSLLSRLAPQTVDAERRTLLTRALGVATLGAAGSLIGYALYQGLRKVAVQRLAVTLPKLATELSGFRIVQLTDIHVGPTIDGRWLRRVVEQVNALQPDVIAITGDLVDGPVANLQAQVAPIGELRARHGVYFVTGNHEYYSGVDEWLAELRRLGVRVLRNEHVTLEIDGQHLDLAGIDDPTGKSFAPGHGSDLPRALAGRDTSRPVILLAHQPKGAHTAADHGVALQISGHTHGGQIFPFNFLVGLDQPFVAGLHRLRDMSIYVSTGTGYWGPPMRLGVPAEITDITLRLA